MSTCSLLSKYKEKLIRDRNQPISSPKSAHDEFDFLIGEAGADQVNVEGQCSRPIRLHFPERCEKFVCV